MKKKKLIILIIILAILDGIGLLVLWQWDNINSVITAGRYESEELEVQIEENESHVNELLAQMQADAEVAEKAAKEASEAEALARQAEKDTSQKAHAEEAARIAKEKAEKEAKYKADLSALIEEVYAMRQSYTSQLEGMMEQAKAEYSNMSSSDKTKSKLAKWAAGYVSKATDLEKECDSKMDDVAMRMSNLIKENNGDQSLVDEVIEGYAKEKSLKKAWYISQLEERGLI